MTDADRYEDLSSNQLSVECHLCFKVLSITECKRKSIKIKNKIICESCQTLSNHLAVTSLCPACNEPLNKKIIKFQDKEWHFECLKCSKCMKSGTSFYTVEGKLVCVRCYKNGTPRCFVCQEDLCRFIALHDGTQLHSECFICDKCGTDLKTCRFEDDYRKVDRKFLCASCIN